MLAHPHTHAAFSPYFPGPLGWQLAFVQGMQDLCQRCVLYGYLDWHAAVDPGHIDAKHVGGGFRIAPVDPQGLGDRLTLDAPAPAEFVTRFQQTTPAITAKGVEDTAFYRDTRLLALNEVGGDPGRFSLSVADFHARSERRAERFPHGLLITQTHDTKRSGDSRARIGALGVQRIVPAAHPIDRVAELRIRRGIAERRMAGVELLRAIDHHQAMFRPAVGVVLAGLAETGARELGREPQPSQGEEEEGKPEQRQLRRER